MAILTTVLISQKDYTVKILTKLNKNITPVLQSANVTAQEVAKQTEFFINMAFVRKLKLTGWLVVEFMADCLTRDLKYEEKGNFFTVV